MSLIDYLEAKRTFYIVAALVLGFALLAVSVLRDPSTFDLFWHLKMGEDLLSKGLSPYVDHYSFTYHGQPIANPPVVFQSVLAMLVGSFGFIAGLNLYKFLCLGLTLLLLSYLMKTTRSPAILYWIVIPLLVLALQWRAVVRPELLSYPLIVLSFVLYSRARLTVNTATMLPVMLLMLVWTNHHSAIFGYIIFSGLFLDHGARMLREGAPVREWLLTGFYGLLLLAVGFLNPQLSHPVIATLQMPAEWKELIKEYRQADEYIRVIGTYALVPVVLATLLLLLTRRQWGLLAVNGLMIWNAVTTARLVTPATIILLCSLVLALEGVNVNAAVSRLHQSARWLLYVFAGLVCSIALFQGVLAARVFLGSNSYVELRYPKATVEYMRKSGFSGNLLNSYRMGGYLLRELSPDIRIYIDGRTNILYPLEHMHRFLEVRTRVNALAEESVARDVHFLLLRNTPGMAYQVDRTGLFELDFVDVGYSLYRRTGTGHFPATGKTMVHAYCWNDDVRASLENERGLLSEQLPELSYLPQFQELALSYPRFEGQDEWIRSHARADHFADPALRFIGFRSLERGQWTEALSAFNKMNGRVIKDDFATALAQTRLGDLQAAEETLNSAIYNQWTNPEPADVILLWSLLLEIDRQRPLQKVSPEIIEQMAGEAARHQLGPPIEQVQVTDFCKLSLK